MTQQWEYLADTSPVIGLQARLNERGPQGWELIYVAPFGEHVSGIPDFLTLVFKRPHS
ncbi:hypothetical protein [Nonomuraea sp. NPDC050786]|uniref:hypothetical protein n=1 Tax=Nonomuraea sp. NPDC050786 TaxID=3154840 RepID=UPI0033EA0B15